MYRVLDIFSGIGGFSLGLQRTSGFQTVAFCEIEKFPRQVLAKHWPDVPIYHDVRTLTSERLAADGIGRIDVICGGFPCQDISLAGKGAGIDGERSGLWSEFARLIGEIRPRYALVENVSALLVRGLSRVLGDLAEIGYSATWHCIPASAVGAPHERDRVWIMADATSERCGKTGELRRDEPAKRISWSGSTSADAAIFRSQRSGLLTASCRSKTNGAREAADALASSFLEEWKAEPRVGGTLDGFPSWLDRAGLGSWYPGWEDGFARVSNGVPRRADRLKGLGNAIVPQIATLIGQAILESEAA